MCYYQFIFSKLPKIFETLAEYRIPSTIQCPWYSLVCLVQNAWRGIRLAFLPICFTVNNFIFCHLINRSSHAFELENILNHPFGVFIRKIGTLFIRDPMVKIALKVLTAAVETIIINYNVLLIQLIVPITSKP